MEILLDTMHSVCSYYYNTNNQGRLTLFNCALSPTWIRSINEIVTFARLQCWMLYYRPCHFSSATAS